LPYSTGIDSEDASTDVPRRLDIDGSVLAVWVITAGRSVASVGVDL
jgi:hypothetical protein